jgi:hypothetical protein
MFIPGIMLKNIRNDKSSLFISEYIGLILACQKKMPHVIGEIIHL